jgi:sigma-B regulation protein RsbU (phosphoserine phosphatase)
MLTSIVKSAFHAALVDHYDPLRVVQAVKEGIRAFDPSRFITLCAARIDIAKKSLFYANAGHPPVLLHRSGAKPAFLDSTGPMISSMFMDSPFGGEEVPIRSGDLLLFYTDGVTEAHGAQGLFGTDRLTSVLTQSRHRGAQLLDQLLASVGEFSAGRPAQDDMTLVLAEFVQER